MKQPKPAPMKKTTPQTSPSGRKGAPDMKLSTKTKGANVAIPCGPRGYESVSIRPIDNGFIVSRSTDKGYSETYSATKPTISVPAPKKR